MRHAKWCRLSAAAGVVLIASACAPGAYNVKAPQPSGLVVQPAPVAPQKLLLNDQRAPELRVFHSGLLAATLNVDGAPLDPPAYLAANLQSELQSRGLKIDVAQGAGGLPRIDLRNFRMLNHRVSGYSPFVTLTFLSVDLHTGPSSQRLGVFVTRGKVPVWSFDEIVEPTLNDPLSIAVKELAAKIAAALGNHRSSDQAVEEIAARLATRSERSFMDVYALGFSNNPRAIDKLVPLTSDADEYVRMAAISSLGTLRATSQYTLLKSIVEGADEWKFRAMALKAIGDLGTAEGKALLEQQWKANSSAPAGEAAWTAQLIGLYL